MWPWTHLAVGYLLYSLSVHALLRRPPREGAALTLAVATQFPDLVDKPLAWLLGVVPGHSVAHSLFIAGPLVLAGMAVAGYYDRPEVGAAWALGYLSHLVGDIFSPMAVLEMDIDLGFLFWPVISVPISTHGGFIQTVLYYATESVAFIFSPLGILFLAAEMSILSAAVALWIYDGYPGWKVVTARFRDGRSTTERSMDG